MSNDTMATIHATIAHQVAKDTPGTLEERLTAAMKAVRKENWTSAGSQGEQDMFRGAVAGVYLAVGQDSPDGQRIKQATDVLRAFNAFLEACSAGLSVEPPGMSENVLPLVKLWKESEKK